MEIGKVKLLFSDYFTTQDKLEVVIRYGEFSNIPPLRFYRFQGGIRLTDIGEKNFADVLDFFYEYNADNGSCIVSVVPLDEEIRRALKLEGQIAFNAFYGGILKAMFESLEQGNSSPNFDKWFYRVEDEEEQL
jgi:hypothetical protein